jgi:hypothetical protein
MQGEHIPYQSGIGIKKEEERGPEKHEKGKDNSKNMLYCFILHKDDESINECDAQFQLTQPEKNCNNSSPQH